MGDVAGVMKVSAEALETVYSGARVTRTVLRSEALRIVRSEPLDLMITSSGAAFLLSSEFLAAFAARSGGLAMLVATHRPDPTALARFRGVGVRADFLELPIDEETLRQRVHAALNPPAPSATPSTDAPPTASSGPGPSEIQPTTTTRIRREYGDTDMANISKSLEEAMKIDGAIAAAIADWDSGLCLGTAGGGARLNIEVAAAGNCQVVKAKMATMTELGIKGSIHDILITLEDQIHLIRPLRRGESLFLYVAIDKAKGNLGMARHRVQKIESELNI